MTLLLPCTTNVLGYELQTITTNKKLDFPINNSYIITSALVYHIRACYEDYLVRRTHDARMLRGTSHVFITRFTFYSVINGERSEPILICGCMACMPTQRKECGR